jgi:hypothetical protein
MGEDNRCRTRSFAEPPPRSIFDNRSCARHARIDQNAAAVAGSGDRLQT